MRFGSFSANVSRPPKILLSLSSSFSNLGSLGRFETASNYTFIKLRDSKFTNSAIKPSVFPSFDLQLSKQVLKQLLGSGCSAPGGSSSFHVPLASPFKLTFLLRGWGREEATRPVWKGGSGAAGRPGSALQEAFLLFLQDHVHVSPSFCYSHPLS